MKPNFDKYIVELLHIHNYVIIPGFGGFIANYKASEINYSRQQIIPPSKEIIFNSNLKKDDGLLTNYIAQNFKISYQQVLSEINLLVQTINFDLNKGKTYTIEGLGLFYFDNSNNVVFEPDYITNFLTDSFGFPMLNLSVPKNMPSLDNLEPTKMNQSNNNRKLYVRAAIISVPIILALSLLPFKSKIFGDKNLSYSTLNPIENIANTETTNTELTKNDSVPVINDAMDDMTKTESALYYSENESKTKEVQPLANNAKYFLIAGSFSDLHNAEILLQDLKLQGYNNSEIIQTNTGLYRVTFEKFEDKFIALQNLTKIRKEKNDKSVWLFTEKRYQ